MTQENPMTSNRAQQVCSEHQQPEQLAAFISQLTPVEFLKPKPLPVGKSGKKKPVTQQGFTDRVVTIAGFKTTVGRFLPVSHDGRGIETYVDKVRLQGKTRAEFIAKKLKGIERRAHMRLYRALTEAYGKQLWQEYFQQRFGSACMIPNKLCMACWNCSLFGGMDEGELSEETRFRPFDTYSVQRDTECIASIGSSEGMGIGNQVYEEGHLQRESNTYFLYEYVKAGTLFPFIAKIETPTLLDVAGYLAAIRRADGHGYGKYTANYGKFATQVLTVAWGHPRFSVLDMLEWAEAVPAEQVAEEGTEKQKIKLIDRVREELVKEVYDHTDTQQIVLSQKKDIEGLQAMLFPAFKAYIEVLK